MINGIRKQIDKTINYLIDTIKHPMNPKSVKLILSQEQREKVIEKGVHLLPEGG